jgi:uncharacterized membrane protein
MKFLIKKQSLSFSRRAHFTMGLLFIFLTGLTVLSAYYKHTSQQELKKGIKNYREFSHVNDHYFLATTSVVFVVNAWVVMVVSLVYLNLKSKRDW